ALVLQQRIGGSIREVVPGAGEPALRELIFAAHVRAERVRLFRLPPAPEEFRASDETPVNRAAQRTIPDSRVESIDGRGEAWPHVIVAVSDRGADIQVRALGDIAIAAQAANIGKVASLVAREQVVVPLVDLTGRLQEQHRVENELRNG